MAFPTLRTLEVLAEHDSVDSLLQLAHIYMSLDLDYAKADATFRQGLALSPVEIPWFYALLAWNELREGRIKQASRLMATASALDARHEQNLFLYSYAWFLNIIGDYEQSLTVSTEALNLAMGGPRR